MRWRGAGLRGIIDFSLSKMFKMDRLEEYYNLRFPNCGEMPVFSALSKDEKTKIRNTLDFASWNAAQALSGFVAAVKLAIRKHKWKIVRRVR